MTSDGARDMIEIKRPAFPRRRRRPTRRSAQTGDRRLQWLLNHEHRFAEGSGFVLTDDYNPLESRQVRKAETYRKHFLERIAFDLLLR